VKEEKFPNGKDRAGHEGNLRGRGRLGANDNISNKKEGSRKVKNGRIPAVLGRRVPSKVVVRND